MHTPFCPFPLQPFIAMNSATPTITTRYPLSVLAVIFCLVSALIVGACDVLDVSNPNTLIEEELDNPAAAPAIANGSEATVTRALGAILAPYSTATDELTWIGSRDAWNELDIGTLDNPLNEFTDAAFPFVGEARWTADEAIRRVEGFREADALASDNTLARVYLYGAIIYTGIADMFDDFVIDSDRGEGAPPVGPSNMDSLYDRALQYIDSGLALDPNTALTTALTGMRARVQFSRAAWNTVNPISGTPQDNLINNAGAVADAQAALDLMDASYVFALGMDGSLPGLVVGDLSMALQVNQRAELGFGTSYIAPEDDGTFGEVTLQDPIDEIVDPVLSNTIEGFIAQAQYADIPVVSAREMHLILAEAALAGNADVSFDDQINALRAVDGLSPYTGQVDAFELLQHSRKVNLYLQGRRLLDHYRFDDSSPKWTENVPGTFLPITIVEIRSNPNLSP